MAARTPIDTSNMSPEEKAKVEKRRQAARAPRAAFIAYNVNEDGSLDIKLATRSADEVLAAVDADRGLKYSRFMLK